MTTTGQWVSFIRCGPSRARRTVRWFSATVCAMLSVGAAPLHADSVPGEYLVRANPSETAHLVQKGAQKLSPPGARPRVRTPHTSAAMRDRALAKALGARQVQRIDSTTYLWRGRGSALGQRRLRAAVVEGVIGSLEPNYKRKISATPNDTYYSLCWGLHNSSDTDIDGPEAWEITTGSSTRSGPIVAVIDTGMTLTHEDLSSNLFKNLQETPGNRRDDDGNGYVDDVSGYDFVNFDADPSDDHFHGTHVAGIVGAAGNNGRGITGVNWNARILPLKVLDQDGSGNDASLIESLDYVLRLRRAGENVRIVNLSLGGEDFSRMLDDKLRELGRAGILVVAAAGNGGEDGIGDNNDEVPSFPANSESPNVISVAAVDPDGALASFSNFGSRTVDIAAPGVEISSTVPPVFSFLPAYGDASGTSQATPFVSGVAALMWSAAPSLSPQEVRSIMLQSAKPLSGLRGRLVAPGMISASRALRAINSTAAPTPTATATPAPALTDLSIESLALLSVRRVNGVTSGRFAVAIRNRGKEPLRQLVQIAIYREDGTLVSRISRSTENRPIPPGRSRVFTTSRVATPRGGVLRAVVDEENLISESDETNNTTSRRVSLGR